MTHHTFRPDDAIPWNLLLPGDTFSFDCSRMQQVARRSSGANNSWMYFQSRTIYLVVSRRIGPELPRYRDFYVFMGPGMNAEECLL